VVLGEGGRVEDDQVVAVADLFEVLHGVAGERRVGKTVAEIQPHVLVGQLHGALRGVDRADLLRSARGGVDRESSRVAEGVEHGAARSVAFHQFAVAALVEEEACLLSLLPVDQKTMAVFRHLLCRSCDFAHQVSVHGVQPRLVGYRLRTLVVDGCETLAVDLAERLGDLHPRAVHPHRMTLYDGRRAVDVDHQSRQRVALAVNEPVAGRRGIVDQTERAPHFAGRADASAPPCGVDRLLREGEHPHGDRSDLVVAACDEIAGGGMDVDDLPLGDRVGGTLHAADCAREDPWVTAQQRLFFASAQENTGVGRHLSFGLRVCCSVR